MATYRLGYSRCLANSGVYFLILTVILITLVTSSHALVFTKTKQTYAKFPKWNACPNSSFSFEFKTNQSKALLMYADDSGKYDYIEVMINDAKVRLRMNIVDGRDGVVEVSLGTGLNDNRWHRVEIKRNRMESVLFVDRLRGSSVAFGSDFKFGELDRNSHVYFGGIPKSHDDMSLPSSNYEPRFEGEIRNVIYWNCTCSPVRGHMIDGREVTTNQNELCDKQNTCSDNCLCIDRDEGPGCQCLGLDCHSDDDTFYHLPMDSISGYTLDNPSGLDARIVGNPETVTGVVGNALKIDCQTSKVKVSGKGHRQECFGNLDLCPKGYTIGFWVKFDKPEPGNAIYLSNGGQTSESHGVAMSYQVGKLQWVFRTKSGKEWHVTANNILPRHWYHVLVTWLAKGGLTLFINGNKISSGDVPSVRVATSASGGSSYDDFIIGQSNDGKGISALGIMTIDDFRFWSFEMTDVQLREMGPIYQYHLSMDRLANGHLVVPNLEPRTHGKLRQIPGKVGRAIYISESSQYIDLGPFYETCIGNTSRCMYGFMASFWIKFYQIGNDTYKNYYITSGIGGFSAYSSADRLYTTVQMNNRQWKIFTSGMENGRWYFIEVSWTKSAGLSLYIDQELKMAQSAGNYYVVTQSTRHDNFYIGRDNNYRYHGRSGFAIDDLVVYNANREKLLDIDFIQRGKPSKTYYSFDKMVGTAIREKHTTIQTFGKPSLVPGKIGNSLMLSGNIQVAQFDHGDGCLGNLDYCTHGVLLALWFRPELFQEGMFYLSSGINGITFSFVDRKFRVSATTTPLKWEVMTSELETRQWYFLETSWGPHSGLKLYANGRLIAEDKYSAENKEDQDMNKLLYDKFVFGKENSDKGGSLYGAALYDEMEFWYGTRDYLLAFNYIQRGKPTHYRIKMDKVTADGKSLVHELLPVRLYGNPNVVSGKINKALQLSGEAQFIDLGASKDTCLGNIRLCHFGKYISMWLNIDEYEYNMYLMSTGRNGIRIYYIAGYIYVTVDNGDESWRVSVPRVSKDVWHFLELSWHPEFGLELWIDGEKTEEADYRKIPGSQSDDGNFYIGRPNFGDAAGQRFSYARMAVDDVEVWYGRRDELLAFDYIVGDKVEYESFSMETADDEGVIYHPRYRITLERGAQLAPGKVGKAVSLSGRGQYVDFGNHMDKCFGNLDLCNHGITLSMLVKPRQLKDKRYLISSPTYSLYYEDRKLKSKFISGGKEWAVSSNYFGENDWNSVMLSWDSSDGLQILINDTLIDKDDTPVGVIQNDQSENAKILLGKSRDPDFGETANVEFDEIQIWYANLEKLRSRGLLKAPVHETLPFFQMGKDGVLKLPERTITVHGGVTIVPGEHRRAIKLNGKTQYIDLGDNLTCSGNLDNCPNGFTMRFSTKPTKLVNNMYFLDSYPIKIFYRDGKLYATVKTSSKSWTVGAPGFKAGEWQVVDVSWHPEVGLTLHVNEEESGGHKSHGTDQMPVYYYDRKTYFGRALTKMVDERYAAAVLENFEIWNVRRDVLISDEKLLEQTTESSTKPPVPPTFAPPPQLPTTDRSVSNDDGTVNTVYVTRLPSGNTQLLRPSITDGDFSGTSKIIRVLGSSWISYDFEALRELTDPTDEESLTLMFTTNVKDGLLWIFKSKPPGTKMHISLKDGNILFVHDDGRNPPQTATVGLGRNRKLNDFRWHTFKIDKKNRRLNFTIDNQLITDLQLQSDIQFLEEGSIDLGGTKNVAQVTNNRVTSNFDGAITDVVVQKNSLGKQMVIKFLQEVDTALQQGFLEIWDVIKYRNGEYSWQPIQPTSEPPSLPTPVTFITGNAVFFLRDALDFRRSGSVDFNFRTLEPRGLLAIAPGSSTSNNFFALEIFDGILYFVYNFDGYSGRKMFPLDSRVDDGEWHDVSITVDGSRIDVKLDSKKMSVFLTQRQMDNMYFYRLYIGGYDEFPRIPWAIYSRQGYKGCIESLRVNNIPVDLHSRFDNQKIEGIKVGCQTPSLNCKNQPCIQGFCQDYNVGYYCDCSSTPFTGRNCDSSAVIASWDGTKPSTYRLLLPDDTHTNDISLRFKTPLSNTLLFSTESQNKRDYVRAEIINGKVVVTFSVAGVKKKFETTQTVNDFMWHNLFIRRRADDVEVRVDSNPWFAGMIGGDNYNLNIDEIKFGSVAGLSSSNNYIGYMQNFIYGNTEILGELKKQPNANVIWITGSEWENVPLITYKPVTVSSSDAHFQLPTLQHGLTMNLIFKFKTREPNGLMLYNSGPGNDFLAIELTNGVLRVAYDLENNKMFTYGPGRKQLNDNRWHTVQVSLNNEGQLNVRVDGDKSVVSNIEGDKKLDLFGKLYIGGLPKSMFSSSSIKNRIESRQGFRGCFASMDLNGAVPELIDFATDKQQIFSGCTDLMMTCKPDVCSTGMCVPGIDSFWCNCNMTGRAGEFCEQYPTGYYFGKNGRNGVIMYEFPASYNSDLDQIAFGFMTKQENAVLYRIMGNVGNEFIEIRLENGHVVAESNTGGGITILKESNQLFNNGKYHVVRYIRTGSNSTLQVDQLPTQTVPHAGGGSLFDKVYTVVLGGRMDAKGARSMHYNGIMGGAYYNGYRWMDAMKEGVLLGGRGVSFEGDVSLSNPFILVATRPPTEAPPPIIIKPNTFVPDDIGGGGSTIGGVGPGGGDAVIGIGGPGGGVVQLPGGTGINVPGGGAAPLASALTGPAPPPMATGARAGAVVGTVLGTMAFMSSLMWALYKLKPGVPTCLSPGAGSAGAGAGGGGMSISSPRTTSNLGAVQAASAGGGGGAGGASGASAGSGGGAMATKVTVVNGSAAGGGGGGAGGGSSTYTSFFQSTSTSVGGAGGSGGSAAISGGHAGVDQYDSATLRATGTFSNKGTAIGSPKAGRANLASSSSAYSANYNSNTMQSNFSEMSGGGGGGGGGGGSTFDRQHYMSSSSAGQDIPDYDMPISGTLQSGQSYSSSTLNTHYNYQVMGSSSTNSNISSSIHTNTNNLFLNRSNNSQSHTSVLNIILSRNTPASPIHSQVYTPALGPSLSDGQFFVDRGEDIVIEELPVVLIINRDGHGQGISTHINTLAEVHLQANTGTARFSSIQANTDTANSNYVQVNARYNEFNNAIDKHSNPTGNEYMTLMEVESESVTNNAKASSKSSGFSFPKFDIFSKNRKASLQVNATSSEFQINKGGYKKMETYASENDIAETSFNSLSNTGGKSNRVSKQHAVDLSHDNLYESTATITSSVRSESMETNLESIADEGEEGGYSEMKFDLLMASLDDFNKNMPSDRTEEINTSSSSNYDTYAKINKTGKKGDKSVGAQSSAYSVTCTAELTDKTKSQKSTSSSSSSSSTTSRSHSRSASPPHMETSLSFDDTLKQFENFVVEIDETQTSPSVDSGDFNDKQTERGEQVIGEEKLTFTKKRKDHSQETTVTSNVVSSTITREFQMTSQQNIDLGISNDAVISTTPSTHTQVLGEKAQHNFDDELNQSVHALLTGIDVDTSGWTSIKDVTSLDDIAKDEATYEVQNLKTVTLNRQGQYVLTTGGFSSGAVTPGAAGDEVRVDCCLITNDGRYVVTGSSLGPPQVWDMQTGELQNIMKGDTIGSTGLHLVCGDRLLVGAVHCDMEINEYSGRKGVFNHSLQIWDFSTGNPLAMAEGEYCSAICPMSDNDKVLFGRSDKFGNATSIIAWDLMGNQLIKEMRYDAPIGNNDYINFLKLSKNDRYIVAGFTNSFDNCAEFVVFDMSLTSNIVSDPSILKLDAEPDCTVILPKDEAVTGLRNGDLVIWSIRTGQPSRQLLGSGGAHAHTRDIKAVALSEDSRYLVSASADGTLKVWDLNTERPIHTLAGHSDEVWCCGISADNEIIVSGSSDGTIRLWRMKNGTEMCVFNCGVDIFHVTMSRDKGTIVALGDKFGARKLIMLQVVRTKIKKIVSSS